MALDNISTVRLGEVCPTLAAKITTLSTMLEDEGITFRITQGLRSWVNQAALYAQGRTAPGPIVTNAPPGTSWHNFGLAVDFVPMAGTPPDPDWDTSHPAWARIITVAESLGLYSGSEFCSIKDIPHLQLTGSFPVSPTLTVRDIFQTVGIQGVWVEAGLVDSAGKPITVSA